MSDLQRYFDRFDEAIRLGPDQEKYLLRKRKTQLLSDLAKGLQSRKTANTLRVRDSFLQGSFAMHTGVRPLSVGKEFDLDLGIVFELNVGKNPPDPVEVKSRVANALAIGKRKVEIRRPCVTVYYNNQQEGAYHLDLAIYARDERGRLYLAKGKTHSKEDNREWVRSDPKGFLRLVGKHLKGLDRSQFHRVVRYLKRWRDCNFPDVGNAAPVGIAVTVLALEAFQPAIGRDGRPDDLSALNKTVKRMLKPFRFLGLGLRLGVAKMPVEPFDNVLSRMTRQQNYAFGQKLAELDEALAQIKACPGVEEALPTLRNLFGLDF